MAGRYEKFTCKEQHLTISCFVEKICPLIPMKDRDGQFEPRKLYCSDITLEEYIETDVWVASSISLNSNNTLAIITI